MLDQVIVTVSDNLEDEGLSRLWRRARPPKESREWTPW